MTEKKNARPTASTAGQAVETGTTAKMASTSTTNDTTPGAKRQRCVRSLRGRAREIEATAAAIESSEV